MRYIGGKSRIAKFLVDVIEPMARARGAYVEPFVGGANTMVRVMCDRRIAGDANEALITMWRELCAGWIPPTEVSEAEYARVSAKRDPADPLTAFVGFGCSFAGKWFGGYARGSNANYAGAARSSLIAKARWLDGVEWHYSDFSDCPIPKHAVVYCDPPYAGTTGYGAVGDFDHGRFWEFCRKLHGSGSAVFVSEYAAPRDFASVLDISTDTALRDTDGNRHARTERLFAIKDHGYWDTKPSRQPGLF